MDSSKKLLSLNRNQIKYLVIAAMLIDHIAWAFVPMASVLGQIMHFIGRLTGPTMAYFLVEGYIHTRDIKKYAIRLGIFAAISVVPFTLFEYDALPISVTEDGVRIIPAFGVIYTLLLSLLAVWLWDKGTCPDWVKVVGITGLCILSIVGDWPVFDVLCALFFFIYKDDKVHKWIMFSIVTVVICMSSVLSGWEFLFNIGVFMVPLLIEFCYNGEGGSRKPVHKWFFYIFYPAHLLILWALKAFVF